MANVHKIWPFKIYFKEKQKQKQKPIFVVYVMNKTKII